MPAPSSYTESSLAAFMLAVLGPVAGVLGWTSSTVPGGHVDEPVYEALLAYGQADISLITSTRAIVKLRVLARREVWRAAVAALAASYDFETDGQSFDRSQMQQMAAVALAQAEQEAAGYLDSSAYVVGVNTLRHVHDPYAAVPDALRVRGGASGTGVP